MAVFKNSIIILTIITLCLCGNAIGQNNISVAGWNDVFSKFKIEVARAGHSSSFERLTKISNNRNAIILAENVDAISVAYDIARNGNKAILIISNSRTNFGENLLTLFNVGFGIEDLTKSPVDNLLIKGEVIHEMFRGIIIGVNGLSRLTTYLDPIGPNAQCKGDGYLSDISNMRRCLAVEVTINNGSILILSLPEAVESRGRTMTGVPRFGVRLDHQLPITDHVINQLGNLEATKILIDWLVQ